MQTASRAITQSIDAADSNYIAADQFISSLVMFILAPAIFGLMVWVYTYNQRKNLEMGG